MPYKQFQKRFKLKVGLFTVRLMPPSSLLLLLLLSPPQCFSCCSQWTSSGICQQKWTSGHFQQGHFNESKVCPLYPYREISSFILLLLILLSLSLNYFSKRLNLQLLCYHLAQWLKYDKSNENEEISSTVNYVNMFNNHSSQNSCSNSILLVYLFF